MYYFLLACILFVSRLPNAHAADSAYSCEAPAQIQAEISQANQNSIETLILQHPKDLWVQQAYINLMTVNSLPISQGLGIPPNKVNAAVIERFKKEYESQGASPEAAYLYAYALIHTDTQKSVKILEEVTQRAPDFPLPWMTLGILSGYPEFRDPNKQRTYTESFIARCPNTLEPRIASLALQLDRSDVLRTYVKALRDRIAGKADEKYFALYIYLWQLESKYALSDGPEDRNKQIKDDLKFLEGLDRNTYRSVPFTLIRGYELIGDKSAMDSLRAKEPQLANPVDLTSFLRAQTEWSRANPLPPPDADAAARAAYSKKQLQFLDSWQSQMPDNLLVLEPRFGILASTPDTPNDVLIHEGDRILALLRRSGSSALTAMKVLQAWAERDILMDRIPSLISEIKTLQSPSSALANPMQQSDLFGGSYRALYEKNQNWTRDTMAWAILVRIYAKQEQLEQARGVLNEWEKALEERRNEAEAIRVKQLSKIVNTSTATTTALPRDPVEIMEASIVSGIFGDEAKFYEACAHQAAAEGRTLDALTFYQSSLRLMYGGNSAPPDFNEIEAGKSAHGLWNQLNGSTAGWKAWLESTRTRPTIKLSSISRWVASDRQIPDFSLSDQHGEKWTLAAIKSKTTLINVWATWCGPCRQELPHLQKLYEQVKDRDDIQIITLNIDEDKSLVEPFLKSNNFSFPALFARPFVEKFAGKIGIPTTWISDKTGTIRMETLGFAGAGPLWLTQTLNNIESVNGRAK